MPQDGNFPEPDAPELITASSHAERNPGLIQSSRKREKIGKAQRAARAIQNQISKNRHKQMISDLDKIMSDHSKALEDLARKHSVKVDYLQKLITNAPTFKKKRAPTLHNAMVHAKAMEINDDAAPGDRKKLPELHQLVVADTNARDLDDEEKKELLDELIAHRKLKQAGARPSNRSATTDYRGVVDNLTTEFQRLSDRTGACAVAFLSRGHLDDTFEPVYICSPNAGNFVNDVLTMGPSDVARLLEQWACSVARKKEPTDTLASMRAEVSTLILQGLKVAAQSSKIAMNYVNYDRQIVESYCVKLTGWPSEKFVSPKEISTVDEIRTLRDALRVGSCKWVRMSKREVKHHMKEYEKRLENGEITKKQQKEQSNKGLKRKRTQPEDNDSESSAESGAEERPPKKTRKKKGKENSTNEGPGADVGGRQTKRRAKTALIEAARRKLKTQLPPAPSRSKSIISDSDLDSDSHISDSGVAQNPPETLAPNVNACNTSMASAPRTTTAHTSSSNLPVAHSTNVNNNTPMKPPVPRCTALPPITNNSWAGPFPSPYIATAPTRHLGSAVAGAYNSPATSNNYLQKSAGSLAGLATAIPQNKHHPVPTHFRHPHSAAMDVRGSPMPLSNSAGSTFMPMFSMNAPFPASEGPSRPHVPIIPASPQLPVFQMSPPRSTGLLLPHHFSTRDNSFYMPPSSSGLTLPPDMLPYSFSTPTTYDSPLCPPYDNRYPHFD